MSNYKKAYMKTRIQKVTYMTHDVEGLSTFEVHDGDYSENIETFQKGYIKDDLICTSSITNESLLTMPTISANEIHGLARTFSFYTKFPKERWPEIKIAEKDDDEGNKMMAKLGAEFDEKYRPYKASNMDLHD